IVNTSINFGTSGTAAGSGTSSITLPVAPANPSTSSIVIGYGRIVCAGAGHLAVAQWTNTGTMNFKCEGTSSLSVGNATPGAWTANDFLFMTFIYVAA
ncbi:MAG TPA: hypothetical protein VE441_14905, partial [Mycobacterium sp.]|nr:hypothetical protein [Mycobacterium sp.]